VLGSCACCCHQEVEAVRAKQRRAGVMAGLPPSAAGGTAAAGGLQQLPQHSPGLEQQLRASQQQQQGVELPLSTSPAPAAAAAAMGAPRGGRQAGEGIFALAHVPSSAAVDAGGAAEAGGTSFEGWGAAGENREDM
jgi:hypothetical protein